jgi:hypothetical protein
MLWAIVVSHAVEVMHALLGEPVAAVFCSRRNMLKIAIHCARPFAVRARALDADGGTPDLSLFGAH